MGEMTKTAVSKKGNTRTEHVQDLKLPEWDFQPYLSDLRQVSALCCIGVLGECRNLVTFLYDCGLLSTWCRLSVNGCFPNWRVSGGEEDGGTVGAGTIEGIFKWDGSNSESGWESTAEGLNVNFFIYPFTSTFIHQRHGTQENWLSTVWRVKMALVEQICGG